MFKKSLKVLLFIFPVMAMQFAIAQPKLGMIRQVNSGFQYYSHKDRSDNDRSSSYGYFGEMNMSIVGILFYKFAPNSKFIIGDDLGCGIALVFPFTTEFHLSYGGQAGYSITSDIDLGFRCVKYLDARVTGPSSSTGMTPTMLGFCARYKRFYGDMCFGSGREKAHPTDGDKYSTTIYNFRYFLEEPERGSPYLGLRMEKANYEYIIENIPAGSNTDYLTFTINYGIMF